MMTSRTWIALAALVLLSVVAEVTIVEDHGHWWNAIPAFYALFGLVGCIAIILISKWLGKVLLQRREEYYD